MKLEIIIIKRVSCEGCSHVKDNTTCALNTEVEVSGAGIPSGCLLPEATDKNKDIEGIIIKALVKAGGKNNGD
jgi:hypothetical protein